MKIVFIAEELGSLAETNYKGKVKYPTQVVRAFKKKIYQIKNVTGLQELRTLKSLHIEKLEPKNLDVYSLRINDSYRLIFKILNEKELEIMEIHDLNNHYQ